MHNGARRYNGVIAVLIAFAMAVFVIGCGGSGGSGSGLNGGGGSGSGSGGGTGATVYGDVPYTFTWPTQTRDIPGYALSVVITVYIGSTNIVADQKVINRTDPSTYQESVSFHLPVGSYRVVAAARPDADGVGDDLARTTFLINVVEGQNPETNLTFNTLITQVFIDNLPSQATVGQEIQLSAHGQDAKHNSILLPLRALDWTLTSGQDNAIVTEDGKLTILQPGSITIQVQEIDTGLTASKSVNLIAGTGNGVVVIVS